MKEINKLLDDKKITNLSNLCLTKHYNTLAYSYLLLFEGLGNSSFLNEAKIWAIESVNRQANKIVYSTSFRHLGIIHEKLGEFDEAAKYYKNILKVYPEDLKTIYCLYSVTLKNLNNKVNKDELDSKEFEKLNNTVKDLEELIFKNQNDFRFKNLLLFGYTLQLLQIEKRESTIIIIKKFLEKNSDHRGFFDYRFRSDNLDRLLNYTDKFGLSNDWINNGRNN